jgi:hypothetical protein
MFMTANFKQPITGPGPEYHYEPLGCPCLQDSKSVNFVLLQGRPKTIRYVR